MVKFEKNLVLFIVTYTEEDKKLHQKAILNWILSISNVDNNNFSYKYSKYSKPYRIVLILTDNDAKKEYIWNFLVAVPIHKQETNNPWELSEDWKNTLIIQMKNNLSLASTIRDRDSKYIITRKNEFYSIAGNPFISYGDIELYPSVIDKASIILYTIVKDHPFYDGNKRTALLTCISFLNSCGFDLLKVNDIEIVERVKDFMVMVANSKAQDKDKILMLINEFILENVTISINYQIWMSKKYSKELKKLIENVK